MDLLKTRLRTQLINTALVHKYEKKVWYVNIKSLQRITMWAENIKKLLVYYV